MAEEDQNINQAVEGEDLLAVSTIRAIEAAADKQLDSLYRSVEPLSKVGYHKFVDQLSRQAYAYGWPSVILNLGTPDLSDEEYDALSDDRYDTYQSLITYTHFSSNYDFTIR